MSENESPEPMTLAQAGQPTKKPVPGATPFVTQHDPNDPAYEVVGNLGFYDGGKLHEVGSVVRTKLPKKPGLDSPGESLKPLGYKGKWPPQEYVDKKRAAEAKYRTERLRDLQR